MNIQTFYIPSFYGDIRIERASDSTSTIVATKTTISERKALAGLTKVAQKKKWLGANVEIPDEGTLLLHAPVSDVQKALVKLMKPHRTTVKAALFSGGAMQEILDDAPANPLDDLSKTVAAPAVAVAVAKPVQGCPAPDFVKAEIKAREVLEVFLNEEQIHDFRKHNRFITTATDSGRRYMLTSRHARDTLAMTQRSLFDLDDGVPFCVHDWTVPAAEELLAIHIMLKVPGHEGYLRHLE